MNRAVSGLRKADGLAGATGTGQSAVFEEGDVARLAAEFEQQPPQALLAWAFDRLGTYRFALVSSFQAEGVVLIDMAWRLDPAVRVITIDTGRLPQETYALIDRVRDRYGIAVEVVFPEANEVEAMTRRHGVNLFYQSVELRHMCCHVRKVLPLRRALQGLAGWGTGLRRDQAPTRAGVRKVELDRLHGGLLKLSPLADWSHDQVWAYIRRHGVPYHPLYDQGYTSIGCASCTRPVPSGEDPRSGRWWWETDAPKECGLHVAGRHPAGRGAG